jgi:hypothetical protein
MVRDRQGLCQGHDPGLGEVAPGRTRHPPDAGAYTDNLADFLQKRSKLCDSEIEQRDHPLRRIGGSPAPMGTDRSGRIQRVYRDYLFVRRVRLGTLVVC